MDQRMNHRIWSEGQIISSLAFASLLWSTGISWWKEDHCVGNSCIYADMRPEEEGKGLTRVFRAIIRLCAVPDQIKKTFWGLLSFYVPSGIIQCCRCRVEPIVPEGPSFQTTPHNGDEERTHPKAFKIRVCSLYTENYPASFAAPKCQSQDKAKNLVLLKSQKWDEERKEIKWSLELYLRVNWATLMVLGVRTAGTTGMMMMKIHRIYKTLLPASTLSFHVLPQAWKKADSKPTKTTKNG